MVWFQCEDCGDNLKKPKLAGHFRQCSAFKLSCIDCGHVFGQKDVESHTQCISEAEKYGPKGQAKAPNGANAKTKNETKQRPEVDVNVGLSERPPWFCSEGGREKLYIAKVLIEPVWKSYIYDESKDVMEEE